jgi:sugar/nucleoside kinase (ribokinase family)
MPDLVPLQLVDYLAIGHITDDITPAGARLGGTAAFAALTARALGLRVGILTAAREGASFEVFEGIHVVSLSSEYTTTFENIYAEDGRKQVLHRRAAQVDYPSVPEAWRNAPIIHLAPLAQELSVDFPKNFAPSLLGVTPQGWMRAWDEQGRVTSYPWKDAEMLLPRAGAVIISREDVNGDEDVIDFMAHNTRVLAVTEGAAGVVLYWHGDRRRFRAPEVNEVDATGAGDIFAAAFFIRLYATRDPWEAARFATQLAARSVTRAGLDGIPTREEIESALMEVLE